jgi:hypothetical protein
MSKYEFSEMRKKLNEAHLDIIKKREYRGARESDVVAWLAEYVENNFVPKKELQEAEKVIKFYADKNTYKQESRWTGGRGGFGDEDDLTQVIIMPKVEEDKGKLARSYLTTKTQGA